VRQWQRQRRLQHEKLDKCCCSLGGSCSWCCGWWYCQAQSITTAVPVVAAALNAPSALMAVFWLHHFAALLLPDVLQSCFAVLLNRSSVAFLQTFSALPPWPLRH